MLDRSQKIEVELCLLQSSTCAAKLRVRLCSFFSWSGQFMQHHRQKASPAVLSTNSHSSSPLNARTQPSSPAAECTNAIDTSCTAPAQVLPPRQKSPARFQTHRAAEAKGSSNPCTSSRSVHQNLALKANLRLLPLRGACRFLPCRTEGSTSPHFSVARLR